MNESNGSNPQSSTNERLEVALMYAGRGWAVLPLHTPRPGDSSCTCERAACDSPGKDPRTTKGVADATTNTARLKRWWLRWPEANVGIATGAESGMVVVDIDPERGGDESFASLQREHGNLPETVVSLTGGGGRHLLFSHPGVRVRNRVNMLPGLDIRGDGGYIVAPPSVHASGGKYEWEQNGHPDEISLAPLPDWLGRLITQPADRAHSESTDQRVRSKEVLSWAGWEEVNADAILEKAFEKLGKASSKRLVTMLVNPAKAGKLSTSEVDLEVVRLLLKGGLELREIVAVWRSQPLGQRDKTRLRDDYVEMTLEAAIKGEKRPGPQSGKEAAPHEEVWELTDTINKISRPLQLIGDETYLTTWLPTKITTHDAVELKILPYVIRSGPNGIDSFGGPVPGVQPLRELPAQLDLPYQPTGSQVLRVGAFQRALEGYRPNPRDVFERIGRVVSRFIDFRGSIGCESEMEDLVALLVMTSYFLDAFTVAPVPLVTGGFGAGKTNLLVIASKLSYLGQLVLAQGTYPTLRDAAHYGATLCFDDAGQVFDKGYDEGKKALILAGNRKGVTVTAKEPQADRTWLTRHYNAYTMRWFSATRLPDPTLASRSIGIPLVRTDDRSRADRDPEDDEGWPYPPDDLRDDLWLLGLIYQVSARELYRDLESQTRLTGRAFQPWRPVLAVAQLVELAGDVPGLYQQTFDIALRYQDERDDLQIADHTPMVVRALVSLLGIADAVEVTASEVGGEVTAIAQEEGLAAWDEDYLSAKQVGRILNQLRITQHRDAKRRTRLLQRFEVERLARAYGVRAGDAASPGMTADKG